MKEIILTACGQCGHPAHNKGKCGVWCLWDNPGGPSENARCACQKDVGKCQTCGGTGLVEMKAFTGIEEVPCLDCTPKVKPPKLWRIYVDNSWQVITYPEDNLQFSLDGGANWEDANDRL